jgi:ribonuclease HI
MAKKKFYVVWKGLKPGIYQSWDDCQVQIEGFKGAQYKSYPSIASAKEAYKAGTSTNNKTTNKFSNLSIITPSLSVDAACSGNPGVMEYQGVNTETKEQVFHQKFPEGTNNIGEFLALVHGLAFLQQKKSNLPVYSDSKIAIGWIKKKACKTKLQPSSVNAEMFQMIKRAESWLKNNTYCNPILKWETKSWGEIPADFGRK